MVIVVSMLIVSAALALRATQVARMPTLASPPAAIPTALPGALSKAADERFSALLGQGLVKAREDALPEAAELLTEAVALRPANAEAWNSLGVVLVRQGQTARGVDAFTRALRLAPNHPEAHRNLAVVLDRQGRSGAAVAHYQEFLRASPENLPARDDVRRRLEQISSGNASTGSESRASRGTGEANESESRAGRADGAASVPGSVAGGGGSR